MPAKKNKLIVLAHGIGDTKEGFHEEWADIIGDNHDLAKVEVKGLLWEDVLDKVAAKYPLVDNALGDVVAQCGFENFKKWVGNDNYKLFHDFVMDILVYVGLPDMWQMIQDECAKKLHALRRDENDVEVFSEEQTILVGHSLGAAMLPHLTAREYAFTGTMPYRGLILLASPLAFVSPVPDSCGDFMSRMGELLGGTNRINVLKRFAAAWDMGGANRLKFIINENDIVCSDVNYQIPGTDTLVDLIPLRQGFDPAEKAALNSAHEDAVQVISFGKRDPRKVIDNHNATTYLKQDAFNEVLAKMLKG